MRTIFTLYLALCAVFASINAQADAMKNSEFLKLTDAQKRWWYMGAFTAYGHLVSVDESKEKSDCVWNWYFKNPDEAEKELGALLAQFPSHAPTSIIIGMLRRDCGVFLPKEKTKPA